MSDNRYNGWTNYETWAVKLWIDNDQGSQEYWLEMAQSIRADRSNIESITVLADVLKDQHEEYAMEKLPDAGVFSDLLAAALGSVNWREIAGNLIGESAEVLGA